MGITELWRHSDIMTLQKHYHYYYESQVVFLLNRTEPNFWSGSGSVHQISVRVRVRFIKPWFRFGFGSSNLGSGSVRFIEAKVWFGFGSVHQISVQVQVRFGSIM